MNTSEFSLFVLIFDLENISGVAARNLEVMRRGFSANIFVVFASPKFQLTPTDQLIN